MSNIFNARVFILFMSVLVIISCFLFTFKHQDINLNLQYVDESLPNVDIAQPQQLPITSTTESSVESKVEPNIEPNIESNVQPNVESTNIQYIDMNAYQNYNRTTNTINIIPSSWQELNEQQLCTLEQHKDSIPLREFLKYVYNIQFPQDCTSADTKFVIYNIELEAKNGLGASLLGNIKRYFAASMMLNRTFLLTGSHDWAHDMPYCQGKDAMECYFLPLSNCNPITILQSIKEQKSNSDIYYAGQKPSHCKFGNNDKYGNLSHCRHKIIHITHKINSYVMLNGDIQEWTKEKFNLLMMGYETLIATYFLRPQPLVRKIIYDKLYKSIWKSFNGSIPNDLSTKTMIAYPIRASDKCDAIHTMTGKHYTHPSEINCFTPLEHVKVMNTIKYLTDDTINTVIFTSEDSAFLQKVIDMMQDNEISNVSQWKVIRNTEDFSVGEGTTTFKDTLKRFENQKLDSKFGTSLETDHIVSALSSLMFQVHLEPEYIVYGDSSTWLKLMWKWLSFLNCNIKPEFHKIDNNKCIELASPGYLHFYGKFPYKFVKFSQELWQRIRNENLEPKQFEKRFGINITKFGWEKYCEKNFKQRIKF